ncbi:MAG TPA: tripartite tricarboxylate transporter substrate binding protein [Burkholderiaceae bacterium]|jgi:tripartite-type tricarboxylate transporter receptor subunit TctC|nr:tripartite tricarboxylate transporter substrate binding protein [Burkholderiaceae bacterium]
MKYLIKRSGHIGAVCLTTFLISTVHAQSDAPITLVVPYGPGGNGDVAARSLAHSLQQHKDVPPLVVLNRSGAGGVTGTQSVATAPTDGKTLLVARVGPSAVAPALDPATPYKWNNFTFIGLLETDPYVCIVPSNSPLKTFQDLTAAIRANPKKISYGTSGVVDASAVIAKMIFLNMGLPADASVMVPYKSGPDTLSAVLGGQLTFACNGLSPYIGSIKGGKVRALISSARIAQLPDVPTASEVGMKDLEMVNGWSALFGPPNLPKAIVAKWAEYLQRVNKDPQWSEQVKGRGATPTILSPEETYRFVSGQFDMYHALRDHVKPE